MCVNNCCHCCHCCCHWPKYYYLPQFPKITKPVWITQITTTTTTTYPKPNSLEKLGFKRG